MMWVNYVKLLKRGEGYEASKVSVRFTEPHLSTVTERFCDILQSGGLSGLFHCLLHLCSQGWCKRSWPVRDTVADEWQARKFLGLELPSKKRDV